MTSPILAELSARVQAQARLETAPYRRPLRLSEQRVDLAAIDHGLDRAKAALVAELRPIVERQIGALVTVAASAYRRGKRVEPERIDVPRRNELLLTLASYARDQYHEGTEQIAREAAKARGGAELAAITPKRSNARLKQQATAAALVVVTRLKVGLAQIADQQDPDDDPDAEFDEAAASRTLWNVAEGAMRRAAGPLVIVALSLGRADGARAEGARTAEVSELLDRNTCEPCDKHDGLVVEVGSAEYDAHLPPYAECDGQDNCRGIMLYDFAP